MARKPADQSVNRQDIILAAADVLHRQGYEATTMKDIAAEVNLTAASLYHHFTNKDALLLAVLEEGINSIIARLEPIATSDQTAPHKLRQLIQEHVTSIALHTAVGAAMVFEIRSLLHLNRVGDSTPVSPDDRKLAEMRDRFFEYRDYFEQLFRSVIEEGIRAGDFREVDAAIITKALLGANNWTAVWYREGGRLSGEQIADMLADYALRSLKAE